MLYLLQNEYLYLVRIMHYIFKTFDVGRGDCIMLLLEENNKELHIMVDCGCYTSEVNDYIEQKFKNKIDYLIVTHIDNDHVVGVNEMLAKKPNIEISHILYNCYQRTAGNLQEWSEDIKRNVKRLYGELPIVIDMMEYKIDEKAAKTLAETILSNDNWKKNWHRNYITEESVPIELGENWGRLVFLSPSQQALDDLDVKYRKLFWSSLYRQKETDYNKEETIYEALMRIALSEVTEESEDEIASEAILDENTLKNYANETLCPISDANVASMAFIWENNGHRILFMGDASPEQVANRISIVYKSNPKPILFDAIKVSHHGSAHSTSTELLANADSRYFFFTGGTRKAPSLQALSRIILMPLSCGLACRELRYNHENESLVRLNEISDTIKEKLHFLIEKGKNEYELFY